jgi:hypothetical protein
MKTIRLLPLVFVAAASFTACSSSSGDGTSAGAGGGTNGTSAVKLADHVTIVEGALADQVVVEAARLVFPAGTDAVANAPVGTILVGDRQSKAGGKNPDGFLRKLLSVATTSEGVVVQTEDAYLTDAVEDGSFQITIQTPELGNDGPAPASQSLAKGPGLHPLGGGKPIKLLDFSGTKIFDWPADVTVQTNPPKTIGFDAFATVKTGTLTFTPTWDIGADVKGFQLAGFHASAKGELDATLEIETGVELKTNLTPAEFTKLVAQKIAHSQSRTLFDYPVDLGTFHLGPLPMPVKADFTAVLNCDFQWGGGIKVDVGGKATGSVSVNLKYDPQNGLSADWDKSASFDVIGPTWTLDGNTHVRCEVTPQFSVNLFGMAFAEVWAKPYFDVGASLTCSQDKPPQGHAHGEAFVGVSAGAHAKAKVLGFKWEKSCTLFTYESDHAKFDKTFTLPGGQDAECTPVDFPNAPTPPANPDACFGGGSNPGAGGHGAGGSGAGGGGALHCTHPVCTAGDPLSPGCDSCTKAVCAKDPYCCEQHWGPSCFLDVEQYCGHKCQ